jgi:DDE superfamily endonuclease
MTSLQNLGNFRHRTYLLLGNGRDALFDLMDAVLTTRSVVSFVELSLSPVFRRAWPSIYEALQDGRPSRQALMKECVRHIPTSEVVVLAGDHTAWSRLYAKTLQERTYEHKAQVISGVKPITLGHGYSTITWIPQAEGSWALPLLHERITSLDTPIGKAATQLRQVCTQICGKVLFLGDGEYGSAPFLKQTADIPCSKLIRLRPNRVLYHAPGAYQGKGRRRKHGEKFSLKDPDTWSVAQEDITTQHDKFGRLRVRRWKTLHLKQAAEHPFDLILVERLDALDSNPFWLIWMAPEEMTLSQTWKQYLRRFTIEHWYRFMRQRLHWTIPQLSTPKQMETWSDLMPLMTWQLWLARDVVEDSPLPWQKTMTQLTPGRIANAFAPLLARIGSPAPDPKPRGKSTGWPSGKPRGRRPFCPTVKKRFTKPKETAVSAA